MAETFFWACHSLSGNVTGRRSATAGHSRCVHSRALENELQTTSGNPNKDANGNLPAFGCEPDSEPSGHRRAGIGGVISSAIPVNDPTAGQVVRRKLQLYAISRENPYTVLPQFPRNLCENLMVVVQLHGEDASGMFFNDRTGYFDSFFFCHYPPMSFSAPDSIRSVRIHFECRPFENVSSNTLEDTILPLRSIELFKPTSRNTSLLHEKVKERQALRALTQISILSVPDHCEAGKG